MLTNAKLILSVAYILSLTVTDISKSDNPFLTCLQFSLLPYTLNELLGNFPFVSHTEIFPHVYKIVYCVTTKFI
jgi:hypothetical protein